MTIHEVESPTNPDDGGADAYKIVSACFGSRPVREPWVWPGEHAAGLQRRVDDLPRTGSGGGQRRQRRRSSGRIALHRGGEAQDRRVSGFGAADRRHSRGLLPGYGHAGLDAGFRRLSHGNHPAARIRSPSSTKHTTRSAESILETASFRSPTGFRNETVTPPVAGKATLSSSRLRNSPKS